MNTPKRVQRTRIKGGGMPEGSKYVGRGSKYGNPHKVNENQTPQQATDKFRTGMDNYKKYDPIEYSEFMSQLTGFDLACWCALPEHGQPDHCHAAVLLEMANPELRGE